MTPDGSCARGFNDTLEARLRKKQTSGKEFTKPAVIGYQNQLTRRQGTYKLFRGAPAPGDEGFAKSLK